MVSWIWLLLLPSRSQSRPDIFMQGKSEEEEKAAVSGAAEEEDVLDLMAEDK